MRKYIKQHDFSDNTYILYARKSTDGEDRQVASVSAQIKVMDAVGKEMDLSVVETLDEASSGFHVGRTEFNKMLDKIQRGEADSILVWKLSRLARNPDDAGRIMGMLQRGEIKHIRTIDRDWLPEDNVMMMYVEFGVTNQFSRDLSDDTTRGLFDKAERGWHPKASLPLGYIHSPFKKLGEEEILTDNKRFIIVQSSLKKVASGQMRPVEALQYANARGLTTKKGKPISSSTFYRMLTEHFYYGRFEFPKGSGNWFDGKHKKAITEEEFNLIQKYRGKKDAPRPQKHLFPYTGMMKCGECGCSIIVDPKVKVQKNGNKHEYHYYRCTKSKGECSQKYLEVKKMEKQLSELLATVEISEAFHEWALDELQNEITKDIKDRTEIMKVAQKGYDGALEQINELVKGYVAKKIPEEAYNSTLGTLEAEKRKYKDILDNADERVTEWVRDTKKAVDFAKTARERFENAEDLQTKNEILSGLGTNIVIKDLQISLDIEKPLIVIKEAHPKFQEALESLEPLNWKEDKEKVKVLLSENPTWGD